MKQIFRTYGAALLTGAAVLLALSLLLTGSGGQRTGFFSAAGGLTEGAWSGETAGNPEKGAENKMDPSAEKNRLQLTLKPGVISAGREYKAEDLFAAFDPQGKPAEAEFYAASVRPASGCRISRNPAAGGQSFYFPKAGIYEASICLTDRRGSVVRRSLRIPVDCGNRNRE